MDIKDIIKWFIPCFHILVSVLKRHSETKLTFLCFILLFSNFLVASVMANHINKNSLNTYRVNTSNLIVNDTKNYFESFKLSNKSISNDAFGENRNGTSYQVSARTFGRPMKKMMQALIPLVFQIGAASTWAVVAALVGLKTLGVALLILKLLLVAGAAKFGSLFSKGGHHQPESWTPPHKEVHLHIHNTPHGGHESYSDWSRDGAVLTSDAKVPQDQNHLGPATINTPYGSYIRVGPPPNVRKR